MLHPNPALATLDKPTTVTFTNETVTGWQQATFPAPIPITANTTYTISYHTNVGRYAVTNGYYAASGQASNPPLQGLAGVFAYGVSAFPTQTYDASNYWVDVVFVPGR